MLCPCLQSVFSLDDEIDTSASYYHLFSLWAGLGSCMMFHSAVRVWDLRPFAPNDRQLKIFRGNRHSFEKVLLSSIVLHSEWIMQYLFSAELASLQLVS